MINGSLADISNSSALHHVPHSETLDSFILWDSTRAVGTAKENDMATALFVAATISSFLGLGTKVKSVFTPRIEAEGHPSARQAIHPASQLSTGTGNSLHPEKQITGRLEKG
jgi:hypothetical protein